MTRYGWRKLFRPVFRLICRLWGHRDAYPHVGNQDLFHCEFCGDDYWRVL